MQNLQAGGGGRKKSQANSYIKQQKFKGNDKSLIMISLREWNLIFRFPIEVKNVT